jgi:hypothetical protein
VENLKLLHQAGVTIAIGSDHAETALAEALHLHQLGVFDNLTLLKMWSETTPQTIFPSRKLGDLRRGLKPAFWSYKKIHLKTSKMFRPLNFVLSKGFPIQGNT